MGAAQDADGVIGHLPEAMAPWASGRAERFPGGKMALCLEPSQGRRRDALVPDDRVGLYPSQPRRLAQVRDAVAPSGQQDAAAAAQRLLALVSQPREKRTPWRPAAAPTRTRHGVVAPRRQWVPANTRLTHRLTRGLNGDCPPVWRWFAALDTPFVGAVLQRWPTLAAVQHPDGPPWRTFVLAPRAHHRALNQQRLDGRRQARPAPTAQAGLRSSVMVVHTLVEPGGWWTDALRRFEPESAALPRSHADVQLLAALPGADPVQASRVIRALGPERRRDEPGEDFRTGAGMAPIMERRGHTPVTPVRWGCPTGLRHAFHECAGPAIPSSPWAKACSRQQRRRGQDHQASVRSLALKWTSMLFQLWKPPTPDHARPWCT